MTDWTIARARETYNIRHWSSGYFDINDQGHVIACPDAAAGVQVDLWDLVAELRASGLTTPVLIRFGDILRDRVATLSKAFAKASEARGYQGRYCPIYPIKVNQQHVVIKDLLDQSAANLGLEAGSKPELLAILGMATMASDVPLICNGYKDREFLRLALIGQLLGYRVHIVIEKYSELKAVLAEARSLAVKPVLGIRVRLASIGKGKWQNTGGEKSKFGLSAPQVTAAIEYLKRHDALDCLQLLHTHLGSQIANIHDIQRGMSEVARYYAELRRLGCDIRTVDVGGGLGIDYEGTRSRNDCSINYSIEEYAYQVVQSLHDICVEKRLPHPDLITEAGRAMTAHHALLVTNVIASESTPTERDVSGRATHPAVVHLRDGLKSLATRPAVEVYHDAVHWMAVAQEGFVHGLLTLEQRALAERLYFVTCRQLRPLLDGSRRSQRQIVEELNEKLADKYFCNFSIFQSLPDVWAIDQVFPILPLHRLDEAPLRRVVLSDITCDSDGRIDHYVDEQGVEATLPLHTLIDGEPYLLGIFLVGAYQETLGDIHNLFGDTHTVNVELDGAGGYRLEDPQQGEDVAAMLAHVSFDDQALRKVYRQRVTAAGLSDGQQSFCLQALEEGLLGYTYLED